MKLTNSTLVIPAVSAGNIPQLTVDLLIHTYKAKFIGRLDDKYLYPFAGPRDEYENEQSGTRISTPLEIYYVETQDQRLTILQMRSPTLPGLKLRFVQETLIPFINQNEFSQIIMIGSSNAGLMMKQNGSQSQKFSRIQLYSDSVENQLAGLKLASENNIRPIPDTLAESGIVKDVLKQCKSPTCLCCGIVMFAYEGDNFSDAEELCDYVIGILTIEKHEWIRPKSWKRVYGREVPVGLEQGLYS